MTSWMLRWWIPGPIVRHADRRREAKTRPSGRPDQHSNVLKTHRLQRRTNRLDGPAYRRVGAPWHTGPLDLSSSATPPRRAAGRGRYILRGQATAFLFIEPLFSIEVRDFGVWINLQIILILGRSDCLTSATGVVYTCVGRSPCSFCGYVRL